VIFLAVWMALIPLGASEAPLPRVFALTAGVLLVLFWSSGVYPGYRLHGYELLRRRAAATLKICAVVCVGALALTEAWRPPLLLALFLGVALAAQPLMRSFVRGLLWRTGLWGEPAEIRGDPVLSAVLADYFARHWQYGVLPAPAAAREPGPAAALVAGAPPSPEQVAAMRRDHADVLLLADFPGLRISGLRPSEIGGAIGLRLGGAAQRSGAAEILHRVLDFTIAGCALAATLPLLAAAAAAIYVVDPGPVLYRQKREGLGGRQVGVLKLRTMYQDADARLEALLRDDPQAREEWSAHFKLRDDPRILPGIGGVLRKTSIDELPQLFNVLAGEIRLVGPRPLPDYHLAAMEGPFQARRRSVMPGLTGLWQISERSAADLSRLQQLDEFYLENKSFWFDLHILLKTAPAVLRGDGAY
jgi:lipopolysaccharide/colanic/teichoic acid biosynthesis glycosyltransferase